MYTDTFLFSQYCNSEWFSSCWLLFWSSLLLISFDRPLKKTWSMGYSAAIVIISTYIRVVVNNKKYIHVFLWDWSIIMVDIKRMFKAYHTKKISCIWFYYSSYISLKQLQVWTSSFLLLFELWSVRYFCINKNNCSIIIIVCWRPRTVKNNVLSLPHLCRWYGKGSWQCFLLFGHISWQN